MPDHQVAFALQELTARPRQPALLGRVRGVQYVEAAGGIMPLVHRPDHGQLADAGFAF